MVGRGMQQVEIRYSEQFIQARLEVVTCVEQAGDAILGDVYFEDI